MFRFRDVIIEKGESISSDMGKASLNLFVLSIY